MTSKLNLDRLTYLGDYKYKDKPEPGTMNPGEFITYDLKYGRKKILTVEMACPRCRLPFIINSETGHELHLHDGLLTVKPSIGHSQCRAHFFITDNKIRQVDDF